MRYLRISAWLAALWLLVIANARAEAPSSSRILLVVDERAVPLATRVAAELETLGFSVETQTRELDPAELAVAARGAGAFAAIGIGPTAAGTVEITVLDRVTGKTVRRELLGRSLEDPTTRELVALRASELLRASLMEIEAPHPPRGEVPPTPAVVRVASAPETLRRPERRWRLGVEGGVLLAPGLAASPLLQATFGVKLLPALELGVAVGSQLTPGERSTDLGRIESTARWLSAGPKLMLVPRRDHGSVTLGLEGGIALLALTASGFASEPDVQGASRFVWSPAGWLGLDSKVRIHKQIWWSFRPAAGYATRELALQADGRELKVWGRPWLWCSTGVEVEL